LTPTPPSINRRIVEALVESLLPDKRGRRLLLVHGRYGDPVPDDFRMKIAETVRQVRVTDQSSVLGIVAAWQQHEDDHPHGDDVLVVTTGVDDAELGWDLRGHAVREGTQTVDRLEIVKYRFGATNVDPRIRKDMWLVDALLDAEPAVGWRRVGSVLTRDAAVRALIGARLGAAELAEGTLDAGALLAWSQATGGPARFADLAEAERLGLTEWLAEAVGQVAPVVLGLAATGRAHDTLGLGLIASATIRPDASESAKMALGALFGPALPRNGELRTFVEAVEGTVTRWITEVESGGQQGEAAQRRVLSVVRSADDLAASMQLTEDVADSRFLNAGFAQRSRQLAGALSATPDTDTVHAAERALDGVLDHAMARLSPDRGRVAMMAVRLMRWLATPVGTIESVAAGVRGHLANWGWVDRALDTVWVGDDVHDPVLRAAYLAIHTAAKVRRDTLDEAFAARLVPWTEHASRQAPGGCLLVEDVLEKAVLPLAGHGAPLVVLVGGMSSAVAVRLGEQLGSRQWTEASPMHARVAAVSVIPSVTGVGRAALLTGSLATGDQTAERSGFAAFWQRNRREGVLFQQGEIRGRAAQLLAEPLVEALSGDDVVGVVLNTVDNMADLRQLLDAALAYRRPVVLVADHGHIPERSTAGVLTPAAGVEAARWRTGTPEAGEISLAGPRVVGGNGRVVVPWREDVRYAYVEAGYHGGASLAEMTVPVLVLLPDVELLPDGWFTLPPESLTPGWWSPARPTQPATVVPAPAQSRKQKTRKPPAEVAGSPPLFTMDELPNPVSPQPVDTLGTRVVATDTYAAQRSFVPRSPSKLEIATVIDALVDADGKLSLTAVAAMAGRAGRNPEFLAITLQRLLNVEGYPVLSIVDGGRTLTLNVDLLRLQFRVTGP
jgi:hypothetical protein